jgi:CMP-N-acetylneuraminic acid synthetase
MKKDNILLIIAARGGSKGVTNKNIRPLNGKPLIAHTVLQAKKWGKADRIICSTDSEAIAAAAKEYGAEVPFLRPAELASDTAGKLSVYRHALRAVEAKSGGVKYDIIVDLDVTAPIRKISDIEGAYQLFLDKRPKSVFSVTPCRRNPYFNMVETDQNGYATLAKKAGTGVVSRQQAPKVWDMNASIYVYDRDFILDEQVTSAISDRSLIWEMDSFSAFDIDHEIDFTFIEFLVTKGLVTL